MKKLDPGYYDLCEKEFEKLTDAEKAWFSCLRRVRHVVTQLIPSRYC